MSNKSINTKGLNRQIEEKANKMQADLMNLRETHNLLQKRFDNESREAQRSQENATSAIQDAEIREQRLKDENELLRNGQEISIRKIETLSGRIQQVNEELRSKSEEKDLLHSRHDALTDESQNLQRELSKVQATVQVLEQDLREEKQHSLDNDRQLRSIAADEIHRLTRTVDDLRREIEDKDGQQAADKDHWEGQRRNLFSEKEKAEEQAAGLQRTISKLQETEGTLSGREMKLKEALESEKLRFQSEEAVLGRQIQDLNADINDKRQLLEDLRSELSKTNDELRIVQRGQADLEEQVETLEDDVEVLQSGFDEEAERANNEITAAEHEIESLRDQLQQAKEENNQLQKSNAGSREGGKSEEQLMSQLQDADVRLKQIKSEKQLLQDKLATNNIELHSLRTASAETEAERDEMKSQVQQLQAQVDEKFKLDQEKSDLRKLKLKLENDVGRLREERNGLLEKHQRVEREFDEQIERGSFEVGSLKDEVADLQRKLATVSGGRDRELSASKQRVQRLEIQITELESRLAQNEQNPDDTVALSFLMKDLATARKRETEHLRSETAHKETIRKLKQNVSQLERQVHEVEISRLAAYSPRSSVGGSARKDEIVEVRRQLAITHQQLKDLRANSRESERELQRKSAELNNQAQADKDLHEQERDRLEQELSSCRLRNDESMAKITSAEKTVARLRTRIQTLEKELQANRVTAAGDLTMADERKDLHEMLKDAKITAESLQVELNSRETLFNNLSTREKELRAHLSRVREERGMQFNKATALSSELESLQSRYENAVDSLARQQKDWEEERRRMTSGMRYPNMATGDFHVCDTAEERRRMELHVQEKEKRHMSELKGLAKQIQWLRAKYVREQSFREGLAHGKRYLLKVIEMHTAWFAAPFFPLPLTSKPKPTDTALFFSSKTNLAVLEKMGIKRCPNPPPLSPNATHAEKLKYALDSIPDPADKKPTLRSVSLMIVAGLRMQRFANAWAAEKKIKAGLLRSLEGVKRRRREASGLKLEENTKGVRKERYVDGEFVRKVEGVFRLEGVLKG